jgi:regulator of protease activity HflC (stomatin/prohibitin superfamily)
MERFRRLSAFCRRSAATFIVLTSDFFASGWRRTALAGVLLAAAIAWKPPVAAVAPGEVGVRVNHLTGGMSLLGEGPSLLVPFVHDVWRYSLRDQVYRPVHSAKANGEAPFQSVEGLSLGVQVTVRYALDPRRIGAIARRLPQDVGRDLIEPVVDGVLYRALSKYTVREVFTARRAELQKEVEDELRAALAPDGVLVRAVFIGNVDLPPQYRQGLEAALAEELHTEKMRYTLELKEKQVRQQELESDAQKIQRQKAAEAAALEEVIAAKGRSEAMRHVLPFKRKEIEQRKLEAEARKVQRTKDAEANAAARRIEVAAEVDARKQLAEAEAYRVDVTGKAQSENMARESALIAQNPLLIQKAMADKLSDKIQVIVAPPSDSGFIGANLLGSRK